VEQNKEVTNNQSSIKQQQEQKINFHMLSKNKPNFYHFLESLFMSKKLDYFTHSRCLQLFLNSRILPKDTQILASKFLKNSLLWFHGIHRALSMSQKLIFNLSKLRHDLLQIAPRFQFMHKQFCTQLANLCHNYFSSCAMIFLTTYIFFFFSFKNHQILSRFL